MKERLWYLSGGRLFVSERGLEVEQVEALERCLSELVIALRLGERARLERHCRELRAELAMHEATLKNEKLDGDPKKE
jgi:hypothetical protein